MTQTGAIAKDVLRSFIERVERLSDEKQTVADDIKAVYDEAKSQGFEPKIMRQIVKLRKMETADRQEQEALLDLYSMAVGLE